MQIRELKLDLGLFFTDETILIFCSELFMVCLSDCTFCSLTKFSSIPLFRIDDLSS
jgi:hypothetical protein